MNRWTGSWLSGPQAAGVRAVEPGEFPGRRLGLPATGPGSAAGAGSRLVAWTLDAGLSYLVAALVAGPHTGIWSTVVFGVEVFLLTALTGQSAGMRLRGLRVVAVDGRPLGPVLTFVRTALLVLLLPALVWDRDGRGLHDRATGAVVVRA